VDSSVVTELKFVKPERRDEVQYCPSLDSDTLNSPMEGISCDKIMKLRQAGLNAQQDHINAWWVIVLCFNKVTKGRVYVEGDESEHVLREMQKTRGPLFDFVKDARWCRNFGFLSRTLLPRCRCMSVTG